jgi:hypothetical protein
MTGKIISFFFTVSNQGLSEKERKQNKTKQNKENFPAGFLFFFFSVFENGSGATPHPPLMGGGGIGVGGPAFLQLGPESRGNR